MSSAYEQIQFSLENGVGIITLNRPERLNSFTDAMHVELTRDLDELEACLSLRGLILTGAGRGFCAGQNLGERKPMPEGQRRDLAEGLLRSYKPLITRLRALPVPVIGLVNGVAAEAVGKFGAGLRCGVFGKVGALHTSVQQDWFVARCGLDLVPATSNRFGSCYGAALFAEPVSALQAEEWGVDIALCAGCRLGKNRVELIAKLASGPTRSYAAIKQALQAAQSNTFGQQFDLECDLQTSFGYTDDYVERVRAFAEKRGPVFKGS